MSNVTKSLARYVKDKGINLSKMSRETGIPYEALRCSLNNDSRERSLRDDEFVAVCLYLSIDPLYFAN